MSWKERSSFNSKRSLSSENGQPTEVFEYKIVMVGTMAVGKTSLAARFVKDSYRDCVNPTIGASYLWRKERIDDKEVKFSIWDTAGQEQFYALVPMYFRDSEAVILVVDTTRDSCEEEAMLWLEKVKQSAPASALVFMALNKVDMEEKRVYTLEAAEAFCRSVSSFRMVCAEVSAKTGEGVHDLFEQIGRACLNKGAGGVSDGGKAGAGGKNSDAVKLRSKSGKQDHGCPC